MRRRSKKVEYNGIVFDSTLELKFALLVEDRCEYIYHPLSIWYDKNDLTKKGKQFCPHKYQPDFLVRKIRDNSATLIEIKSSPYINANSTKVKRFVAERYIKDQGYDWKFKILTERDFMLNELQMGKFKEILKTRKYTTLKQNSLKKEARLTETSYRNNNIPFRTNFELEEADHILYVRKGLMRELI